MRAETGPAAVRQMEGADAKRGSGILAGAAGPGPVQLLFQLALLVGLHVAGLALFTRGFMLTRVELPVLSSCADYEAAGRSCPPSLSAPSCHQSKESQSQESQQSSDSLNSASDESVPDTPSGKPCVQESPFDRVVILVIDAARYGWPLVKELNLEILGLNS